MNYSFANRIETLTGSVLRENAKKRQTNTQLISFAYGYPSVQAFPMETLGKISEKLYTKIDPETFLQYGATEGDSRLRQLIAARLRNTVDIQVKEDPLIVSGSTQAIDLVIKTLCNEGDIVLCEAQTFSGAVNAIKSYGAIPKAIPFDVEEQSMDLAYLEKTLAQDHEHKIKLIYVIPTFQNPLGTSMPLERRQALYALACQYDVLILEDDPYGDLLYTGKAIPKIKSLDNEERVIYAGSFSKILAPSTRLGFIVAPTPIFDKLVLVKQTTDSHTNFYWQVMLAEFMQYYAFEAHVETLKQLYARQAKLMMSGLQACPSDLLTVIEPTGGYFICCHLTEQVDPLRFYDYLETYGLAVIHGNIMSVSGKGYDRYFRLNFTKPSPKEIQQGCRIIQNALIDASVYMQPVSV